METLAHRRIKQMAVGFLRASGCLAVAAEVRCPISRYRVDVAGYRDAVPGASAVLEYSASGRRPRRRRRSRRCRPRTVLIECKQSRGDFLRDRRRSEDLLARREHLERIRRSIERNRIVLEEPHLRRGGSSLFPELDEWDFAASRLSCYREVLRKLRRLDRQVYGETKFCMIARYELADELYVAAPCGMIRRHELPTGWGLLECPPQSLQAPARDGPGDEPPRLHVRVAPESLQCRDEHRQRLLRNIAVAASFAAAPGTR